MTKIIKCLDCGKEIIKDHNCRIYCSDCVYQRKLIRNRKREKRWRDLYPEKKKEKDRLYSIANRKKINQYSRNWAFNVREKVLVEYGNKCECCGENKKEFLCIDHINGGGFRHRKSIKGRSIYAWLRENNYPKEGFRILCHNCNSAKGYYGYCPHEKTI